ncbi:MAG: hypothetical protein V8Q57_01195 [Blautia sp.]
MGLFNYAQNVYFILLMIASFSIPQAVSKIMAEKLAFKRYRDAQKVFHCALFVRDFDGRCGSAFLSFRIFDSGTGVYVRGKACS